ncbi:MAG TPA: ATP-binding protein [Kofleriaceae bacterium]
MLDSASNELASTALVELARSLRTASVAEPPTPTSVDRVTHTIRIVAAAMLDAIERDVSAKELRAVAEWFSAITESVLGDDNRRLVAMLDALDDHVILLDPEARVLFLNRSAGEVSRTLYDRSRADMIGSSTVDGPGSQQHKQYVRSLVARASSGETIAEEFLLPTANGALWHEHHFRPVYKPDGALEAIAIASREIHGRKQAEGRLQLLSKIGLVAGATDLEGILSRAAGLAIPELADWTVFELVQGGETKCSTVVHPDVDRSALAERLLRAAAPRHVSDEASYIVRVDDELRARDPVRYSLLQQLDATTAIVVPFVVMGTTTAVATFAFGPESGRRHSAADLAIADEIARRAAQIVENARLHAELRRELTYRERVMGILGHDLRNPVAAVLSLSSTLSQRADVAERSQEGLRHIHQSAQRMEQMISSLLDFTQIRFRGVPTLALESCDFSGVARAVVDELRAANPTRDITLDARGELRARADVSRIGQVMANLVGNALTHGARESPVSVTVTADNEAVMFGVTNRGPTIPSDAIDKLFEPFWQAPKSGARGLGLGLFIVHQIVNAHAGAVDVRSQNEQTTFTVRLPR